jgi:hypothetical protein
MEVSDLFYEILPLIALEQLGMTMIKKLTPHCEKL